MATKQLYATGTFKYQNRMLQAGDPVEMTDPHRRLYTALGKVSDVKPKSGKANMTELESNPTTVETVNVVAKARKPAAKKKAPAKKKAK